MISDREVQCGSADPAGPGFLGAARVSPLSSRHENGPLVVEFIGVTGVGKSTLVAAVAEVLSAEGIQVLEAHEAILAPYRLTFARGAKVRSLLVHFLAVLPFLRYAMTRRGLELFRLGMRLIARDGGGLWIAVNLLRNFVKRIGGHLLLMRLRPRLRDCDVVLWDEGVVHAAHNLFVHTGSAPRRHEIALFARMVPKPDVLVWVTAPVAQSLEVTLR